MQMHKAISTRLIGNVLQPESISKVKTKYYRRRYDQMRSLKEGVQFLKEAKNEGVTEAMTMIYCPTPEQKKAMMKYVGVGSVLGCIMPVMASGTEGETLSKGINKLLNHLFGWIFGITTSLAALLILIAFIQYMVSSDPQTAHMAKSRIFKIIFAWIAINCIGTIIKVITDLATDAGGQYQYNAG
jgi:hypothetical protein